MSRLISAVSDMIFDLFTSSHKVSFQKPGFTVRELLINEKWLYARVSKKKLEMKEPVSTVKVNGRRLGL
jgi:hypothetical protein